ncbi:hypothetical protein J6590_090233 [Homalodisca vitripennis]|nr:hypothetical protein J6590_090233 [Homalodisca vitripennis]
MNDYSVFGVVGEGSRPCEVRDQRLKGDCRIKVNVWAGILLTRMGSLSGTSSKQQLSSIIRIPTTLSRNESRTRTHVDELLLLFINQSFSSRYLHSVFLDLVPCVGFTGKVCVTEAWRAPEPYHMRFVFQRTWPHLISVQENELDCSHQKSCKLDMGPLTMTISRLRDWISLAALSAIRKLCSLQVRLESTITSRYWVARVVCTVTLTTWSGTSISILFLVRITISVFIKSKDNPYICHPVVNDAHDFVQLQLGRLNTSKYSYVIRSISEIRTQNRALRGATGYSHYPWGLSGVINKEAEPEVLLDVLEQNVEPSRRVECVTDIKRNKNHHLKRIAAVVLDCHLILYNDFNSLPPFSGAVLTW